MLKSAIRKYANRRNALLFFAFSTVVYVYMLAVSIPEVSSYADGMKILDMMPSGYGSEYVHALFSALGKEGREVYLFNQIPLDLVYPFLYGVGYCLLIAYFLQQLNKFDTFLFNLSLLPLIAGLFDYFENIGTGIMLSKYPDVSDCQIGLNSFFTLVKSMASSLFFSWSYLFDSYLVCEKIYEERLIV